ncbi:LPXTG cell wall anchor domain-containing protein [Dactylosporangium sp. CA-052675]|uniref:LPXTG cell wall anchor domain-containing protein n=1 Tax=Dactylosporangium sp. CA-052675 TaxID=3239927 RepID=UPI003D8CCA6D
MGQQPLIVIGNFLRSPAAVEVSMRVIAAALAGCSVAVLPATVALAADPKPDLAVTITADQPSFAENAPFSATAKVTNHGSAKAVHAHIAGGYVKTLENLDYGALETGFDLDAGATQTFKITGTTTHLTWRYGSGPLSFTLESDNGDANDADNSAGVNIEVPGAFGDVLVRVCVGDTWGDCGDGSPGVPGVKVVATDTGGSKHYAEGTTDANGVTHLTHIPAGSPLLQFSAPAGWKMLATDQPPNAQIVEGQPSETDMFAYRLSTTPTAPASPSPSVGPGLPVTGSNTALLVTGGAAAVAIGAVLVLLARRRRVVLRS